VFYTDNVFLCFYTRALSFSLPLNNWMSAGPALTLRSAGIFDREASLTGSTLFHFVWITPTASGPFTPWLTVKWRHRVSVRHAVPSVRPYVRPTTFIGLKRLNEDDFRSLLVVSRKRSAHDAATTLTRGRWYSDAQYASLKIPRYTDTPRYCTSVLLKRSIFHSEQRSNKDFRWTPFGITKPQVILSDTGCYFCFQINDVGIIK